MAAKQLKNAIQHKLTVALLAGDLVATWDSVAGWPTTGDFIIRLDDVAGTKTEFVLCTAVNVGLLQTTIVRGQESTSGTAFSINDLGTNDLTAQMMADAFVRLDTALSQTLTGPLVIPPTLGGSPAATSYGSMPLKIAESLLVGAAASVTFSSLPSTFRTSRTDWYARGDTAATGTTMLLRLNNDAAANYDWENLDVNGSTTLAAETLATTSIRVGFIPAATATANYFGVGESKVAHYAGTTGNKGVLGRNFSPRSNATGDQLQQFASGKWRTTATAVNRKDFLPGAGNFVIGSYFGEWMDP